MMKSPEEFKRVPLPGQETLPLGWFAISHHLVNPSSDLRRLRNRVYRIKGPNGTVYRVLRFAASLKAGGTDEPAGIVIDWQGWSELQALDRTSEPKLSLQIRRSNWWGALMGAWKHPEPGYRLSMRIATLSLALGVLSLLLAVVI